MTSDTCVTFALRVRIVPSWAFLDINYLPDSDVEDTEEADDSVEKADDSETERLFEANSRFDSKSSSFRLR